MCVVSKKKSKDIRKKAIVAYEKSGQSGIYAMGINLDLTWRNCEPCATQTPSLETIDSCECLVCGQSQEIEALSPIQYVDEIPKSLFDEFLTLLEKVAPHDYAEEAKDDFVDLYNYWVEAGYIRLMAKHNQNKEKLTKV